MLVNTLLILILTHRGRTSHFVRELLPEPSACRYRMLLVEGLIAGELDAHVNIDVQESSA